RRAARRAAESGFTLIELLAYLAIFSAVSGTIVEAELAARRMHRWESAGLDAMYQADRFFASVAEDCDRSTGVSIEQGGRELRFAHGSSWVFDGTDIKKDGSTAARGVGDVGFTRPDDARSRLLFVTLHF